MAGTWMSIVEGFGGKRVINGDLSLFPLIPEHWDEYSFKIVFRNSDLLVTVNKQHVHLQVKGGPLSLKVYNQILKTC
jgi:maltose phosphorylase